jgi:hypothetical protein
VRHLAFVAFWLSPPTNPKKNVLEVKRYNNLSGDSGVVAYELRAESIIVQFQDGWKYEYTAASAGADAIGTMHSLAIAGRGLSTFISTSVRERYARKFR